MASTASDLRGASSDSQEALVAEVGATIGEGADGARLAEDLFAVAGLLSREPGLRRILTDQSLMGEAKGGLVRRLLGDKVEEPAAALVAKAAGRRWAGTRDLGYALEHAGVVAVVVTADQAGHADALEEELFAFGQMVTNNPSLRDALSDPARTDADKRDLLRDLLEGRVTSGALRLAEQATSGSHRTVSVAVEEYQKVAAEQRQRLVALVRTAHPLTDTETQRLADALSRQYERPVHLNVVVDPGVIGGVRVEVADDVIDGTIATRLEDARRRLAG